MDTVQALCVTQMTCQLQIDSALLHRLTRLPLTLQTPKTPKPAALLSTAAAGCWSAGLLLLVLLQQLSLPLAQRRLCCPLHVALLRRLRRTQLPRPVYIPAAQHTAVQCNKSTIIYASTCNNYVHDKNATLHEQNASVAWAAAATDKAARLCHPRPSHPKNR